MTPSSTKIKLTSLEFFFRNIKVLDRIDLDIVQNTITAVTGPSGQGKSTFLMTLNRLWEPNPHARIRGKIQIRLGDRFQDIYEPRFKVHNLRRAVGMVFQAPNPLPMGIYKNIAFPLKLAREEKRKDAGFRVEQALRHTFLWEEVKDRLHDDARSLSGGQQQRLCMARAMILKPEVLLLDEPTASLDERAARVIEDLLMELKQECTLILVSHYQDQVKLDYLNTLGPDQTIACGNGANDRLMLEGAAIGISVLQAEGMASKTFAASDILIYNILDLFGYIETPGRLIACLRQ